MTTGPVVRCLACEAPLQHLLDHCFCEEVVIRCPTCGRREWTTRLVDDGEAREIEVVCSEECERA